MGTVCNKEEIKTIRNPKGTIQRFLRGNTILPHSRIFKAFCCLKVHNANAHKLSIANFGIRIVKVRKYIVVV